MSFGDRAGSRDEGLLELNNRWVSTNPLTLARDRRRLGDVNILDMNDHSIKPTVPRMVKPITPAMVSPLVRKMGETTIQQRRDYGSQSLWANTPVANMPAIVGDPDIMDVSELLVQWERVGFSWDRRQNKLCAYLTANGKTYVVKIPMGRLCSIFNRGWREQVPEEPAFFREKSLDGFFKKLSRGLKKLGKGAARTVKRGITAPVRLVKNPRQFVRDTGRRIKKTIKGIGKKALSVASSPIFAGVMTAVSAIPPLTAVGGAGLAAFAAANAMKPAFKAVEKTIDVVDALGRKRPGGAVKALTSSMGIKADSMTRQFKTGLNSLPTPAKRMMVSALRSTDARQLTRKERRRRRKTAFRFKPRRR